MGDVRWMFHATAMGADYDAMLDPLARLFGARVMHRQQLEAPVGPRRGMVWIGDNSIEIGAPVRRRTRRSAAFVERFGGGMHSVAVQVADLAATLRRLEPLGVEVATRIGPEIVFTRPGATAGLVLEWASHVQDDDPRWGAPMLPFVAPPVVAVDRMAFVAALVRDPARGCPSARRGPRHARGSTTATAPTSAPTCPPPRSISETACSRCIRFHPTRRRAARCGAAHHERPRCIALALSVTDQGVAERALAGRRASACTTGPATVGSCSIPARCRFPSCSRSSCCPAIPAPRGPRRTDGSRDERLWGLLEPSTTAVLTMELQNGVVGEGAMLAALVEELERAGTLDAVRRLCDAAREAGARVVHCTVVSRPDGAGSTSNCKIFALAATPTSRAGTRLDRPRDPGCRGHRRARGPRDIVVPRLHGMTPFTSTSLDQILRNLGIRTVIATGVSVNLGVIGMALIGASTSATRS